MSVQTPGDEPTVDLTPKGPEGDVILKVTCPPGSTEPTTPDSIRVIPGK